MRRIKTLYASSDSASIDTFIANLARYGYDVVPCTRGATALRMLEEHRFDIAIISLDIIGLNGFETCRALRERFDDFDLPIVLRAERDSAEWRLTAFECGANSFAFEPISFDRLDRVMRSLLKFKLHHEGQMSVAEALKLLDTVYVDPGERVDTLYPWPQGSDFGMFARYGRTLAANYLDVSDDKKDELLGCFTLLLHMAERIGTLTDAIHHFASITKGTRVEHIAREIELRCECNRELTSAESECPACIEALIVMLGHAMYRVCMGLGAQGAFHEMRSSSFTYDADLLGALESIVRKDEFLDSIFTTEMPA